MPHEWQPFFYLGTSQLYLWNSTTFHVPSMWKQLCFDTSLFIEQSSSKGFANLILISTVGLYELPPNSLGTYKNFLAEIQNWHRVFMCREYLVFINGYILQEISDNHIAGLSAKKLLTSRAAVCDCLTDVTPLFYSDTMSDCTAVSYCWHGEGGF